MILRGALLCTVDLGDALAAEARLVGDRAVAWLRGDVIQALASATELDREVFRVKGLDEDGHPKQMFGLISDESADALAAAKEQRALGGVLRGLGRFVKASAEEFAQSVRRPPLAERPEDAVLECVWEIPREALAGVERWKQPLVPEFEGGPRWLQIHFADSSWARLKTDERGLAAYTSV